MSTHVVNVADAPGIGLNEVYVGRPSRWGNPFCIGLDGGRATVIAKFRDWLDGHDPDAIWIREHIRELRGKTLRCYCKPLPCHGDVLAELADQAEPAEAPA